MCELRHRVELLSTGSALSTVYADPASLQDANYHLCPKPLLDALNAAPRGSEYILVNAWGRKYANARVLSGAIRDQLTKLGLRASVNPHFSSIEIEMIDDWYSVPFQHSCAGIML